MRLALVNGTVTLSRAHPSLGSPRLRLAQPLSLTDLRQQGTPASDEIVVWDELGAGDGSLIAVSEGREAAQPFQPAMKPIDAYNAALLDHVAWEWDE